MEDSSRETLLLALNYWDARGRARGCVAERRGCLSS